MAWIHRSLDLQARRLLNEASAGHGFPLLALPSTDASFHLIRWLEKRGRRSLVVGNPGLAEGWGPAGGLRILTPREAWRELRATPGSVHLVAVFQDQLVAMDDSYVTLSLDGQRIHVSPIEAMILMKFETRAFVGSAVSRGRGRPPGLRLSAWRPSLAAPMTIEVLNEIMAPVLRGLLSCVIDPAIDWYARRSFALKQDDNFQRVLVQQIQEMEALVRIYEQQHAFSPPPALWLETLRECRAEIAQALR